MGVRVVHNAVSYGVLTARTSQPAILPPLTILSLVTSRRVLAALFHGES